MVKHDEISSTERLLGLIRGKSDKEPGLSDDDSPPHSPAGKKIPPIKDILSFRRTKTIGVDIGYNNLRLVEINRFSDSKQELSKYLKIPYEHDISRDSPQFSLFLKSALKRFCNVSKKVEIWSPISSANVDTRYLRIPKVPMAQIANAVYWTYKKEASLNEKTQIFDFEVLGDIIEDGVRKTEVLSYAAPKNEINELKRIFSKIGYPLTGISIVPFALQNLFRTRWIEIDGKNICTLFIGRDWSRIAIFSKGNLVLSRDVKAGILSMTEAIRERVDDNFAKLSSESTDVKDTDRTISSVERLHAQTDLAQNIFHGLTHNALPLTSESTGLVFDEETVFDMVLPALERVVRQVEKTVEHYYLNFGDEAVSKIYISGQVVNQKRMVDYIENQLNLQIDTINPFPRGLSLPGKVTHPDTPLESGAFVPAVGMALSSNSLTPNFIFTYKDKQKTVSMQRINRAIVAAFSLLIFLGIGVLFWQDNLFDQKKAQRDQLQTQMDKYSPQVDQKLIVVAAAKTSQKMQRLKAFGDRYFPMAVISEISEITPSDIHLLSINANMGNLAPEKNEEPKRTLTVEGVVFGDRLTFEASLAGYLVKLKGSSIFTETVMKKRSFEFVDNKEVLRFSIQLELV
ncbi:hypothetical protein ACFL6B_01145 [Thermodesulfobacteriota bacterium]